MVTETMDYQGMVAEFMKASGQVVNTAPTEMTTELAQLRYNLFIEEVRELKYAIITNDRVEQLDALVDITYILCGTAATMGRQLNDAIRVHYTTGSSEWSVIETIEDLLVQGVKEIYTATMCIGSIKAKLNISKEIFDEAFHRVHVSNMSKFPRTAREAEETVAVYTDKGVESFWVQRGDIYVVLRRSDNKVLKSINYNPVDLTDLV